MRKNPSYTALLRPTCLLISEKFATYTIKWSYTIIWRVRVISIWYPELETPQWSIEARIGRRDGIFPHEWWSHKWKKLNSPWVMSGLTRVTNAEFYPSFLLILASISFLIGKWWLNCKAQFSQKPKEKNNWNRPDETIPHNFELNKTRWTDKFLIVCNNEP